MQKHKDIQFRMIKSANPPMPTNAECLKNDKQSISNRVSDETAHRLSKTTNLVTNFL